MTWYVTQPDNTSSTSGSATSMHNTALTGTLSPHFISTSSLTLLPTLGDWAFVVPCQQWGESTLLRNSSRTAEVTAALARAEVNSAHAAPSSTAGSTEDCNRFCPRLKTTFLPQSEPQTPTHSTEITVQGLQL